MGELVEPCEVGETLSQSYFVENFDFSFSTKEEFFGLAVVVTPICDFAQKKADYVTFCAVLPINPWLDEQKSNARESKLDTMMKGNMYRYHWIGKLPGQSDFFFIDYQLSVSLRKSVADAIIPFAKATRPLSESIVVGFGRSFTRVGLPFDDQAFGAMKKAVMDQYNPPVNGPVTQ